MKITPLEKAHSKETKVSSFKLIYYISFCFFIAVFLFSLFATEGESAKCLLFADGSDTFMDHFNSVIYNEGDPYEQNVIYPPLACLLYKYCNLIIPSDDYGSLITDYSVKAQPRAVKISQSFLFQFIIFAVIAILIFLIALTLLKKGEHFEKLLFSVCVLFSTPFIFMADRGNNILLPVSFTIFFILFKDNERKVLRELALISLAIAVGLKIYPAVFALLLFTDKKYPELLRLIIYCIITTILPFFIFYNGFSSLTKMLTSIAGFSGKRSSGENIGTQLDFKRVFYFLYGGLRRFTGVTVSEGMLSIYATLFKYALTFICILGALFSGKCWKKNALLCAIIYGFPGSCSTYLLLFMIIPIAQFLDEETAGSVKNYFYLAGFILSQVPLIIRNDGVFNRYWPTKISSVAVCMIVGVTFCELVVALSIWNAERKSRGIPFAKACKAAVKNYFSDVLSPLRARKTGAQEAE